MRGRFEADAAGELRQLITTDNEPAGLPVDVAQARLGCNDSVQAARLYLVDETSFTS